MFDCFSAVLMKDFMAQLLPSDTESTFIEGADKEDGKQRIGEELTRRSCNFLLCLN